MLKVGLIGCGYMGMMHLNCYKALADKVEIAAIADIREEKTKEFSEGISPAIYNSAEELINNADVDFVDICLPTYLHTKYAVMAMEKGFDVFVEKPLCMTEEEAELLKETQKKTGKLAQVGQVIRFWDEYVWLKEAKESGRYGKVISASFKRLSPYPGWAWDNWLHQKDKSGGMALDLHIHDIDFARYLMGDPKEVCVNGINNKDGLTDYILTSYHYDDAVVTCEGCWSYPADFRFTMAYCVMFEKATVYFDSASGDFILYPAEGGSEKIEIKKDFDGNVEGGNVGSLAGYYNELKYFVDRLENPALTDIASIEEGAKSVKYALMGYNQI